MSNRYYQIVNPELAATYNNLHNQPTAAEIAPEIIYHLVEANERPGSFTLCCFQDAANDLPEDDRVTLSEQVCNCPEMIR
jgi:hypothetical protein